MLKYYYLELVKQLFYNGLGERILYFALGLGLFYLFHVKLLRLEMHIRNWIGFTVGYWGAAIAGTFFK